MFATAGSYREESTSATAVKLPDAARTLPVTVYVTWSPGWITPDRNTTLDPPPDVGGAVEVIRNAEAGVKRTVVAAEAGSSPLFITVTVYVACPCAGR